MNGGFQSLALLALAACAAGVALPANAGSVYRCEAADGSSSYSSSRISGARCTVVSSYTRSAKPAGKSGGASRLVHGQVYSYVKNGVRHYSSKRPRGATGAVRTIQYSYMETCHACAARPGVDFSKVRLNTVAYNAEVAAAAREYGVDEAIVRAIIHAESSFDPKALSHAGAQGLMQLMPATARRFGVNDAFDARQNIRGGVEYLSWLLDRFDGNLTLAAAGYNAGEGNVDKYDGVPPFSETQRYVKRVGVLAERYRGALAAR